MARDLRHALRGSGATVITAALQLSTDRDPNAIHGEALAPGMVTLKSLVLERLVSPASSDLVTNPPRIASRSARTRSALGYLQTNCGSCHDGEGEIAVLGPSLRIRELLHDGDAVARRLVAQPTRWQVPGVPDGASLLVNPHEVDTSAMLVRMRSRRPSSQMPPLGTVVRDQAAVDAIAQWIARILPRSDPAVDCVASAFRRKIRLKDN